MANYECACRTSYFRVDDEEKYAELFNSLGGEDAIDDFTKTDEQGNKWHAFGSYGPISPKSDSGSVYGADSEYEDDDDWPTLEDFFDELSKIIRKGDACIYMEGGHEKLRYVTGEVYVVTRDNVMFEDLEGWARKQLVNISYDPNVEMYY